MKMRQIETPDHSLDGFTNRERRRSEDCSTWRTAKHSILALKNRANNTAAAVAVPSSPSPSHELPSYHASQGEAASAAAARVAGLSTVHESALEDSAGHRWLVLRATTRPRKAESLPIFMEGDTISGSIELDLKKGESAKSVVINVIGGSTFVGQDETIFLKLTKVLWTPPDGKKSGKLQGKYSLPFSFPLPKQVEVKDATPSMHNLPPHFTQRASPVYVDYRLQVEIKRGFLKVDKALRTTFGYQINTVAEPPSALRELAYSEGTPVLGPKDDPNGWKVLPPVQFKGTLNGTKDVEVEITLAIATPLTYALGSPIPLFVTLKSDDTQALDELAKPQIIALELVRSMATGPNALDDDNVGRSDNFMFEGEGFAYWWTTPEANAEPNTRTFRGEMEVPKTVKPTFLFPRCSIRYTLNLLPPTGPEWGNVTENLDPTPLLSERIKIVARQAPGIKMRSDAPPGYDKHQTSNYLKSVGLLENGNQRFMHAVHGR